RRGKNVPHPAEVAFAFFSNVADEHEGQRMADAYRAQQRGDGQHRDHAGSVVGDSGAVDAASLLANVQGRIRRKYGVDVGAERDVAASEAGMRTENVAYVVDADVI